MYGMTEPRSLPKISSERGFVIPGDCPWAPGRGQSTRFALVISADCRALVVYALYGLLREHR